MTQSSKVLAKIAWCLGAERILLVPTAVALIIGACAVQPVRNDFSATTLWIGLIVGVAALDFMLSLCYAPVAGKSILRSIEQDFGPKTSDAVYTVFAEIKKGDTVEIDIPELAKSLGEQERAN